MEDLKHKITSKFDKKKFELLDCNSPGTENKDDSFDCVDKYIRSFIKDLNNSEHITTFYSCEGHRKNDSAYIYFNVDETGWDLFFLKIVPELSFEFLKHIPEGLSQLDWRLQIIDNEFGSGISIHCSLNNSTFSNWKQKKELFWNTMKEHFLKNFKDE